MKQYHLAKTGRAVTALVLAVWLAGCASAAKRQEMTQAPSQPLQTAPAPPSQTVRQPLAPQTLGERLPDDYEDAQVETVLPDSSTTFDPLTYGRPGSPYNRGALFAGGAGSMCGPMDMPMSTRYADPGESQAVILIFGNGAECLPDIDHDKPGAAVTFTTVSAPFAGPGWTIVTSTSSTVTIRNGTRTLRFTYRVDAAREITSITKVEFLS